MGQIQSNVGLITGIPIADTVDQLMAVAGRPRDTLISRTEGLAAERSAFDQVASLLLGVRFTAGKLKTSSIYSAVQANSSDRTLLSATTKSDPPPQPGTYTFTPLQKATTHQVVTSTFSDIASQLETGSFSIGVGGHVNQGLRLSELNNGQGVTSGYIRVTDRSGASAEVDLRAAVSIDDVVEAINSNGTIDVTASIDGDSIKLTDNTGGGGNLRVRDVGIGTTATALGLDGINVAAEEVTGSDVYDLHANTLLRTLNDGSGVNIHEVGDVLTIQLADNSEVEVDVSGATTLGNIVDAINESEGGKVTAAIVDGNRLALTDLTSGSGTLQVTSTGSLASDLGLTESAVAGTLTGRRLVAGLSDTLISSLNGGQGYEALGSINITDRAGNPAVAVDLSSAETLGDVVSLINASGANVTAAINNSRSGIVLKDSSGGSGNLAIASADATQSAEALGIAIDDSVASVDSGSLNRQTVSASTSLEDFGGTGVTLGSFRITDSNGAEGVVKLNTVGSEAETVGDVIDAINALATNVEARINGTGDGIEIVDLAGGTGTLTVADLGSGSSAADLRIAGTAVVNDAEQQVIDGRTRLEVDLSTLEVSESIALSKLNNGNGVTLGTFKVEDSSGTEFYVQLDESGDEAFTIDDVIEKINTAAEAAGAGVTASLNSAGTGLLLSDTAGGNGTLTVSDVGSSGTTAAELKIAGEASAPTGGTQTINGSGLFAAQDSDRNALESLVERINDFGGGFVASTFFDGTGYRLSINSENAGAAQELLVETSGASFSAFDAARPKDAVLQFGSVATGGIVITSTDNTFEDAVPGLTVTLESESDDPVTVEVAANTSGITDAVSDLVESFNSFRDAVGELTAFDSEAATTGLLFGRTEIVTIETQLANVITGRFSASASLRSLESLGIGLNDQGKLELDTTKLTEVLESSPGEFERLFTSEGIGVVERLEQVIDQLAGEDTSLLARRSDALTRTIESNEARIATMNLALDRERERTLLEFYRLEETISTLQANFDILDSIQGIQPVAASRSSG